MLKSNIRKGQIVGTIYGPVQFDEQGVSNSLTPEQQKEIAQLTGYTYEEDKKPEPKKPAPKKTTQKKPTPKKTPKVEETKSEETEEESQDNE